MDLPPRNVIPDFLCRDALRSRSTRTYESDQAANVWNPGNGNKSFAPWIPEVSQRSILE